MQRSQSSISMDSIKQKKFWRSLTGSKESPLMQLKSESTTESSSSSLSPVKSSSTRLSVTPNRLPTINEPRMPPSSSRPLRSKKRQSLMVTTSEIRRVSQGSTHSILTSSSTSLSSITASVSSTSLSKSSSGMKKRESYINRADRRQSNYNFSPQIQLAGHLNNTPDPKELDFYKSLLSRTGNDQEEPLEKTPESEEGVLKIIDMHTSIAEEEPQPQTIDVNTDDSDLTSTLADYRLFTERALDFEYETSPISSFLALPLNSPESHSKSMVSSDSVPSFASSIDTLNSKASIMYTGGALWVGIECEDLDLNLNVQSEKNKKKTQIGSNWCNVNSEEIFTEDLNDSFLKVGNRTSLMFV
ncbi:hypothetical protein WICPIJ_003255 [Wickerhamomyces pijperi]|uniref:Uncharacterized protein n=1 Tax=Wickerhamomyces pijperi TaxID=599730 RepID=A0A9P8Q875_WICPI|nr:hypothetical protein WICPIJ_003255 [Wickerhamomyces pijperi]